MNDTFIEIAVSAALAIAGLLVLDPKVGYLRTVLGLLLVMMASRIGS